jgi:hypothetical protein
MLHNTYIACLLNELFYMYVKQSYPCTHCEGTGGSEDIAYFFMVFAQDGVGWSPSKYGK